MFFRRSYILAAPLQAVEISDESDQHGSRSAVVTLPADSRVTVLRRTGKPGMVEVECGDRRYAILLVDLTTRAELAM